MVQAFQCVWRYLQDPPWKCMLHTQCLLVQVEQWAAPNWEDLEIWWEWRPSKMNTYRELEDELDSSKEYFFCFQPKIFLSILASMVHLKFHKSFVLILKFSWFLNFFEICLRCVETVYPGVLSTAVTLDSNEWVRILSVIVKILDQCMFLETAHAHLPLTKPKILPKARSKC